MAVTKYIFWTEYTDFDKNIGSFHVDEFTWKSKDIKYGNSDLWHQKCSLPCNKVLDFFCMQSHIKVLGIGEAERSLGDIKTIKPEKRSTISSDVSEKQSIVYTSTCIESSIIEQYHSDKQLNTNSSSHNWNEED